MSADDMMCNLWLDTARSGGYHCPIHLVPSGLTVMGVIAYLGVDAMTTYNYVDPMMILAEAGVTADGKLNAVIVIMSTFGLAAITGIIWIIRKIIWLEARFEAEKSRTDELWQDKQDTWKYLAGRAKTGAVLGDLGKVNSPLSILGTSRETEVREVYEPLLPLLLDVEKRSGLDSLTDANEDTLFRFMATQHDLMDILAKKVCPVLRVGNGECVALAVAVLREYKSKPKNSGTVNVSISPPASEMMCVHPQEPSN
jgi:hypothetical protein